MTDADADRVQALLDRTNAGDAAARGELLAAVLGRLEAISRGQLNRFPRVRRFEDTCDVVQDAAVRLLDALAKARPATPREFFNLSAALIRRELIDSARHYYGPRGAGTHERTNLIAAGPAGDASGTGFDPPSDAGPDAELDRWAALHEAVEGLPVLLREVFSLTYYHGWEQTQIAELLHLSERTVRRLWKEARDRVAGAAGEDSLPPAAV